MILLPPCTCFHPWSCAKVGYQQYPGSLWGHALHHRLDGLLVWTLSDNLVCILFVLKPPEFLVYSWIMYIQTYARYYCHCIFKKYFKRNDAMCAIFQLLKTLLHLHRKACRRCRQPETFQNLCLAWWKSEWSRCRAGWWEVRGESLVDAMVHWPCFGDMKAIIEGMEVNIYIHVAYSIWIWLCK